MCCFYRVLIYGSHAILINLCKDKNGKIPFSSASVVLLSEVIKVRIYMYTILINLCKDKNGKIPFSSASVVLLSEVIKVRICTILINLCKDKNGKIPFLDQWSC